MDFGLDVLVICSYMFESISAARLGNLKERKTVAQGGIVKWLIVIPFIPTIQLLHKKEAACSLLAAKQLLS